VEHDATAEEPEPGSVMHAHQLEVSARDVRRLLAAQFPQWAHESVRRLPSYGTTNAMYRLGADKVARLPFIPGDGASIAVEASTLEHVAGRLPVPTPRPLAIGEPDGVYPFRWSVLSWLPGHMPVPERLAHPDAFVEDLAGFLRELQTLPTDGVRVAQRGGTLAPLDAGVREAIGLLADEYDATVLTALWDDALAAAPWAGAPVWLHSDLLPSNLLVDAHGRLAGVLDWASAGVGDPACELLAAWNVFPARARERFRAALGVDDATWRRGRGWAVSQAVLALPYYRDTNPGMVEMATRALAALVQESV
jgi:aminoglycoside phosphotransferase (APT) family kinase protein